MLSYLQDERTIRSVGVSLSFSYVVQFTYRWPIAEGGSVPGEKHVIEYLFAIYSYYCVKKTVSIAKYTTKVCREKNEVVEVVVQ